MIEDAVTTASRFKPTFGSRHGGSPHPYGSMILMRFSNDLLTMSFWRSRRSRLRDFSCIPWFPPPLERRTRPDPVTRNRLAAARFVFIFGTGGSSFALSRAARDRAFGGPVRSGGASLEGTRGFVKARWL